MYEVNEVDTLFREEVREKALLARASHYKKRPRSTPQINNFSHSRWQKMNGDITNFNLSEPMAWIEFKKLPVDMQNEYVTKLVKEYEVGTTALAEMFGISCFTCSRYMHSNLDVIFPKYSSCKQRQRFLAAFCNQPEIADILISDAPISEQTIAESAISEALIPIKEPSQTVTFSPIPKSEMMALKKTTLSFSGLFYSRIIADKLSALFGEGVKVNITVDIETIE